MEQRGAKRVEMVGQNDKCQITAVLVVASRDPVPLIYKGKQ